MAANMYLKFSDPTIAGDASERGHQGEIQVLSWSHSFNQPGSPTRTDPDARTAEQANHSSFSFSKYHDSASAGLLRHCWEGKQIGKAVLRCYRSDADNASYCYLEIEMAHVVVSNISIGAGGGDIATENVSLDYGIIAYRYEPKAKNVTEVSHDLIQRIVG